MEAFSKLSNDILHAYVTFSFIFSLSVLFKMAAVANWLKTDREKIKLKVT
jgi:hypothetical protein